MGSTAVAAKSAETKQREALAAFEVAPDSVQLKQACGASAGLPRFLGGGCGCDCKAGVQTKLVVGSSGDQFEREADRVAEAVSGPAKSHPQAAPTALQTPSGTASAVRPSDSGSPLPSGLRGQIEPVLGASLGHVRVHDSAADREVAKGLQAKAFTHGSHIWLGPSQSSSDLKLMAHEATHVAQQGAAGRMPPDVQRLAEDSAGTKPNPAILRNMLSEVPARRERSDADGAQPDSARRTPKKPQPAEYRQKKNELLARGKPAVDTANSARPKLEHAADQFKKNSRAPPQPAKSGAAGPTKTGKAGDKGKGKGGSHGGHKRARLTPRPPPTTPAAVKIPQIAVPRDAAGEPLAPDSQGDAQILKLAAMAQVIRVQGFVLRQRAVQEHHNAIVIQSNMARVQDGIAQADEGIDKSKDHLSYRREVLGQAQSVLHISEQKAEKVAAEAPGYQSKSAEGKADSGPMAGEAKDLASENAAQTPDDDDAGEESAEQGGKINKVGSDIGSMDDAMGKTQKKADSLVADAAHAKEKNELTRQNVAKTHSTLDQTGTKINKMSEQNMHAQSLLDSHAAGPGSIAAGAASLDRQGEAAIESSIEMEQRIHSLQQKYLAGMRNVPKSKRGKPPGGTAPSAPVQRQAEPAAAPADDRINLNLAGKVGEALPSWVTGEEKQSDKERAEAQAAEKKRREDEINEINAKAGGDFNKLSVADKAGIALSLTGRHLFGSVAGIKWPGFLRKMAQGLIDPRIGLMGIVSGLSMALSGARNLVSWEQWKKDPLGNLLQSAADIASGITIVLGSITALAMAIIAIMVAAAILSFGFLGPVAAAVIPFCWTVVGTVGPWTIFAAKIALVLNALLLIKDLIDAATADTAEKLQGESDKVTDDAKTAGNMVLQIGMDAVGKIGGEALASTQFGKGLAAEMRGIGEDFGIVKPAGGVAPAVPEGAPVAAEGAAAKPTGAAPPDAAPAAAAHEPAPSTPEAATQEGKPSQEAATSGEAPKAALDERMVAEQPTVGGHTVKVNEAGECLVCTTCKNLEASVAADLAPSEVSPTKRAEIEAEVKDVETIEDPVAKAKAGAEVKAEAARAGEDAAEPSRPGAESDPAPAAEPAIPPTRRVAQAQARVADTDASLAATRKELDAATERVQSAERDLIAAKELASHEGGAKLLKDTERELLEAKRALSDAKKDADLAATDAEAAADSAKKIPKLERDIAANKAKIDELFARNGNVRPPTSTPDGVELSKLEREQRELTEQLQEQMDNLTGDWIDKLRKGTPGEGAMDKALQNLGELPSELRTSEGAAFDITDPAQGKLEAPSPDHIYPVSKIVREPGFGKLTRAQQRAILELGENYMPLTRAANSSKGSLTMDEWFQTDIGKNVPAKLRPSLREVEIRARTAVQDRIAEMLASQ